MNNDDTSTVQELQRRLAARDRASRLFDNGTPMALSQGKRLFNGKPMPLAGGPKFSGKPSDSRD